MRDGEKFFAISISLIIGLGLAGVISMFVFEMLARAALPEEMRTPEMIQRHYDGAVCLSCEMSGYVIVFLTVVLVTIVVICFAFYRLFAGRPS
ncbi:MAG: hypothetical protein WKF34_06090 [Pyrinomonadaceae bacterium]